MVSRYIQTLTEIFYTNYNEYICLILKSSRLINIIRRFYTMGVLDFTLTIYIVISNIEMIVAKL